MLPKSTLLGEWLHPTPAAVAALPLDPEVDLRCDAILVAVEPDYDGVIYDLDGTVVSLSVDWIAVQDDVVEIYETAGIEADGDLWTLFEAAESHGLAEQVEDAIATHERDGADKSSRLPLADELCATQNAIAVCSLNCEEACRIALETHGLAEHVRAIVGRDTVDAYKPDPRPLEYALSRIGVAPDAALFIGDSKRDALTASRAGIDFRYVDTE